MDQALSFTALDYAWFATKVEKRFNVRLSDYKPDQMRRRLATLAERSGATSFVSYFAMLETDRERLTQFLDQMTINVTELLRNPSLFSVLMDEVLLDRFPRREGEFRAWSAGCSYGAEAYSLAMLLHERASGAPFRVRGTDVDLTVLARASSPSFTTEDMANVNESRRQAHFFSPDGATYLPQNHLRARVEFGPHDLLGASYPVAHYDLVLCRNVLIYFTDQAKERIYQSLFRSLRPGGVLFVGGSERLTDHAGIGFSFLKPFFYERPAVQRLAA